MHSPRPRLRVTMELLSQSGGQAGTPPTHTHTVAVSSQHFQGGQGPPLTR